MSLLLLGSVIYIVSGVLLLIGLCRAAANAQDLPSERPSPARRPQVKQAKYNVRRPMTGS
jgi:hypothetical protein